LVGCKVDTGFAINVICIAWWKWSCLADVPQCDSACWKQLDKWTKCFACSLIFVLQFKWINWQTSWHIRQQRKVLGYKSVTVNTNLCVMKTSLCCTWCTSANWKAEYFSELNTIVIRISKWLFLTNILNPWQMASKWFLTIWTDTCWCMFLHKRS